MADATPSRDPVQDRSRTEGLRLAAAAAAAKLPPSLKDSHMVQGKDRRGGWGVRVGVRAGLGRWIWMLAKGSQTVRIKEEHGAARLRKARDLGLKIFIYFSFFLPFRGMQHGVCDAHERPDVALQQENELQSAARQIFLLRLGMFSLLLLFLNVILSQCFGLIDTRLSLPSLLSS